MSEGVIAAITGALFGGLVSGAIGITKYLSDRRSLKRALRVGLYFEIEHHDFTILSSNADGQPNFLLTGYQDHFYRHNISDIFKLFDLNVVMMLAFYYSKLNLVTEWQSDLESKNNDIRALVDNNIDTEGKRMKYDKMRKDHEAIKELLRVTIVPCINARGKLLLTIKKRLPLDPSKAKFIDVPPEYEEWWKTKLDN